MKAKFVRESLGNVFKPKTEEEIINNFPKPNNMLGEPLAKFIISKFYNSSIWNNEKDELLPLIIGNDMRGNLTYWIYPPFYSTPLKEDFLYNIVKDFEEGNLFDKDEKGFRWKTIIHRLKTEYPHVYKLAQKPPVMKKPDNPQTKIPTSVFTQPMNRYDNKRIRKRR